MDWLRCPIPTQPQLMVASPSLHCTSVRLSLIGHTTASFLVRFWGDMTSPCFMNQIPKFVWLIQPDNFGHNKPRPSLARGDWITVLFWRATFQCSEGSRRLSSRIRKNNSPRLGVEDAETTRWLEWPNPLLTPYQSESMALIHQPPYYKSCPY